MMKQNHVTRLWYRVCLYFSACTWSCTCIDIHKLTQHHNQVTWFCYDLASLILESLSKATQYPKTNRYVMTLNYGKPENQQICGGKQDEAVFMQKAGNGHPITNLYLQHSFLGSLLMSQLQYYLCLDHQGSGHWGYGFHTFAEKNPYGSTYDNGYPGSCSRSIWKLTIPPVARPLVVQTQAVP